MAATQFYITWQTHIRKEEGWPSNNNRSISHKKIKVPGLRWLLGRPLDIIHPWGTFLDAQGDLAAGYVVRLRVGNNNSKRKGYHIENSLKVNSLDIWNNIYLIQRGITKSTQVCALQCSSNYVTCDGWHQVKSIEILKWWKSWPVCHIVSRRQEQPNGINTTDVSSK